MYESKNKQGRFVVSIIILLLAFCFWTKIVYAGTLSCLIGDSVSCSGKVIILRMQNTTNSHAGLPIGSTYTNLVCCSINGATLGTSCTEGIYSDTVLRLSGANNAHVRQDPHALGDYPSATNACISVPVGGNVLVGYVVSPQTCIGAGYDTFIASMIGTTNSHIGDGSWVYGTTKICATATGAGLSTTILIRNVADTADVATITFPPGNSSAVISNPTGNVDLQVLTATASEAAPVAILKSATAYTLWYNVTSTSTWGDAVASEKLYTIAINGDLDLTTFGASAYNMTVWGTDQETTQSLAAGVNKELYLQVTLSALAGKSGTSTLSVLGEAL